MAGRTPARVYGALVPATEDEDVGGGATSDRLGGLARMGPLFGLRCSGRGGVRRARALLCVRVCVCAHACRRVWRGVARMHVRVNSRVRVWWGWVGGGNACERRCVYARAVITTLPNTDTPFPHRTPSSRHACPSIPGTDAVVNRSSSMQTTPTKWRRRTA